MKQVYDPFQSFCERERREGLAFFRGLLVAVGLSVGLSAVAYLTGRAVWRML